MPTVGVVIPVGRGREENLRAVLGSLEQQRTKPDQIVVVFDGPDAVRWIPEGPTVVVVPKHQPGMEQPRNAGVDALRDDIDIVWFIDSDVIVDPGALEAITRVWRPGRVVICPYEWMGPGCREPQHDLYCDMRWEMFREERWADPEYASVGEWNVGLACFSGNLAWDREAFERIGGFWSEIHHGRCEDGELGLRTVAARTPITCAPDARGWHMHHDINTEWVLAANARDVPMINERYPRHPVSGHFLEDTKE
jgi:glycosyltransferase involved in cell wall biosynthesis